MKIYSSFFFTQVECPRTGRTFFFCMTSHLFLSTRETVNIYIKRCLFRLNVRCGDRVLLYYSHSVPLWRKDSVRTTLCPDFENMTSVSKDTVKRERGTEDTCVRVSYYSLTCTLSLHDMDRYRWLRFFLSNDCPHSLPASQYSTTKIHSPSPYPVQTSSLFNINYKSSRSTLGSRSCIGTKTFLTLVGPSNRRSQTSLVRSKEQR